MDPNSEQSASGRRKDKTRCDSMIRVQVMSRCEWVMAGQLVEPNHHIVSCSRMSDERWVELRLFCAFVFSVFYLNSDAASRLLTQFYMMLMMLQALLSSDERQWGDRSILLITVTLLSIPVTVRNWVCCVMLSNGQSDGKKKKKKRDAVCCRMQLRLSSVFSASSWLLQSNVVVAASGLWLEEWGRRLKEGCKKKVRRRSRWEEMGWKRVVVVLLGLQLVYLPPNPFHRIMRCICATPAFAVWNSWGTCFPFDWKKA